MGSDVSFRHLRDKVALWYMKTHPLREFLHSSPEILEVLASNVVRDEKVLLDADECCKEHVIHIALPKVMSDDARSTK